MNFTHIVIHIFIDFKEFLLCIKDEQFLSLNSKWYIVFFVVRHSFLLKTCKAQRTPYFVVRHSFLLKTCTTLTRAVALRLAQNVPHFVHPPGLEPGTSASKAGMISISLWVHILLLLYIIKSLLQIWLIL